MDEASTFAVKSIFGDWNGLLHFRCFSTLIRINILHDVAFSRFIIFKLLMISMDGISESSYRKSEKAEVNLTMSDIQAFYKATKIVEEDQRFLDEHGINTFATLLAKRRDVWKKAGSIENICDDTFTLLCGLVEYLEEHDTFDEESFVTFLVLHGKEKKRGSILDDDDEFQLESQGFNPSSDDSLENDEDEDDVDDDPEGPYGPDKVKFNGVWFQRRSCYHYKTREGLNTVAIRSFTADETMAHCVLILPVKDTFLGQHGITELYPKRYKYVQVWKRLSPIRLSKLRELRANFVEPKTMPPLCYTPQQKGGRQSFGYFFENDGSNRVGHRGEKRVVELFCGAGGMHQGYKDNGFVTEKAIDKDDDAVQTFRYNNPESADAVESIDVNEFLKVYKVKNGRQVHLLHASSPCQGFSRANRLGGKQDDKNNELALTFTKGLKKTNALMGVFENVEGMWSRKGIFYLRKILMDLVEMNYQFRVMILRGKHFSRFP